MKNNYLKKIKMYSEKIIKKKLENFKTDRKKANPARDIQRELILN